MLRACRVGPSSSRTASQQWGSGTGRAVHRCIRPSWTTPDEDRCLVPGSDVVGVACVRGLGRLGHPSVPRPGLASVNPFRWSAVIRPCPTARVPHEIWEDTWDDLAGYRYRAPALSVSRPAVKPWDSGCHTRQC